MSRPFLTFYTPTFRRPLALRACMASVHAQTAAHDIEHLIVPDLVGRGVGGMFTQIPQYADAVHGEYVHILADDDTLAAPDVVAAVREFAIRHRYPPVIVAKADKGGSVWPSGQPWPPICGAFDLGCTITRADVWRAHVTAYGDTYEGDYHFAASVAAAGHQAEYLPMLFLRGGVMRGAPELVA